MLCAILTVWAVLLFAAADTDARNRKTGTVNQDADAVARELGMSLMGLDGSATTGVRYQSADVRPHPDPIVRNGKFILGSTMLSEYKVTEDDPNRRDIQGIVIHRDHLGRCIYTGFTAGYRMLNNGSMRVDQVSVQPVESAVPRVFFYFVPAEKVMPGFEQNFHHENFLKQMDNHAVRVKSGKSVDRSVRDYYAFAFIMDRLGEDADVSMTIIGSGASRQKRSIQRDGWHLVYARERFDLDGAQPIQFKLFFRPRGDNGTPSREKFIGSYSTNMSRDSAALVINTKKALKAAGYNPGPMDDKMTPRLVSAIKQFQKDHHLRVDGQPGSDLLNVIKMFAPSSTIARKQAPRKISPIKIMKIQHWLKYGGYYAGPLNGKLNPKTQEAIERYKKDRASGKLKKSGKTVAVTDTSAMVKRYKTKMWRNRVPLSGEKKISEGYAILPEPVMFVVPSTALKSIKLPGNYAGLIKFIGERAAPVRGGTLQRREYSIFVFLKDKVSPTSEFEVKISKSDSGKGGADKGIKYLFVEGQPVAYLTGKFTLFDGSEDSLFYIKALFSPGKEVGLFSRSSKRVGLFASDGT